MCSFTLSCIMAVVMISIATLLFIALSVFTQFYIWHSLSPFSVCFVLCFACGLHTHCLLSNWRSAASEKNKHNRFAQSEGRSNENKWISPNLFQTTHTRAHGYYSEIRVKRSSVMSFNWISLRNFGCIPFLLYISLEVFSTNNVMIGVEKWHVYAHTHTTGKNKFISKIISSRWDGLYLPLVRLGSV